MEVPTPARFLRFRPTFPSRRHQPGYAAEGGRKDRSRIPFLIIFLVFLQFGLHALFLGQLTTRPLFWGLLVVFYSSLLFSLFQVRINKSLHGWLWGFLLILLFEKVIFYPSIYPLDNTWLKELGTGFQNLFGLGKDLLSPLKVGELVSLNHNATAALFFTLSILLWLPAGVSMDRALRYNSWGWFLIITLLLLVWLEPTRTFPFFFPLELMVLVSLFLLLLWRARAERWRSLRLRHEKGDLKRVVLWSLLVLVPLLIFLFPWAWGSAVHFQSFLPKVPPLEASTSPPPSIPQSTPASGTFPYITLPPFSLPSWVEVLGGYSSYIAIILFFLIGAFVYFRFGKGESLLYFLLALGILALALWLLPPYLGPILTKAFYYLKVGVDSLFAALGLKRGTAVPGGTPTGPGEGVNPETSNWIAEFIRSLALFFSQASVILITIGAVLLAVILFFVLKFGLRRFPKIKEQGKRSKEARPQASDFLSPLSFYFKLLRILEEKGIKRRESETPWEYERRAASYLPFIKEEVGDLTEAFVEARYAQIAPSSERVLVLEKDLAQVERKFQEEEKKRVQGK